ncbi:hypothetical protein BI081_gp255 [Mycobacterium phage Tonenili]|uniref:Uncharacterized protein n=1 Tax=Mycobacterium phage Tonenili TaxID=1891703 RepID=A0A1C9EH77_9CAUD|nr:hypothetical protein BI081_gp255 [Mycobacterium phage Tonenili]AON96852.1 hypothetical protein SEA_TONENILI_105 [Mycobacterium phage Tonenili]
MHADAEVTSEIEIGLKLPDGTQIFPPETFHGSSLATAEDRQAIHAALLVAAANMGYPPDRIQEDYSWIQRENEVVTIRRPVAIQELRIDDPRILSACLDSVSVVDNESSGPPGADGDTG